MKKKLTQSHKIRISVIRDRMKKDGAFDGRFVSRAEKSKKTYTRKFKHKNRKQND